MSDLPQIKQKLNIKEQEVAALKVQNRHLLFKLEEAEQASKPNQINTAAVATEIQKQVKPVILEVQRQTQQAQVQIEKTLQQAFQMIQSTLRGIYQQSQRAQQSVEESTQQSKEIEKRLSEARKADQIYYQEKIFSLIATFLDRMERQIDQRMGALSGIDIVVTKQNETLKDIGAIKAGSARVEIEIGEAKQNIKEADISIRDIQQLIQNHRAEFKLARAEVRALVDAARSAKKESIGASEASGQAAAEDLTTVLELLRAQKAELSRVAKDAENYLRHSQEASAAAETTGYIEPKIL